jgi:DNA-directed RNA polymerase specialized sigma24 family protein
VKITQLKRENLRVEVLGRYSNLCDQGERIQDLLRIVPEGSPEVNLRTRKQVQHRLNADEVDELVKRYRAGAKVGELAANFGVHRDTVSEQLDRQGVARRQKGLAPELLSELIALYRSGSSLATIGAKMSVDPGTVALALRKAGTPLRPRRGWPAKNSAMRRPS